MPDPMNILHEEQHSYNLFLTPAKIQTDFALVKSNNFDASN